MQLIAFLPQWTRLRSRSLYPRAPQRSVRPFNPNFVEQRGLICCLRRRGICSKAAAGSKVRDRAARHMGNWITAMAISAIRAGFLGAAYLHAEKPTSAFPALRGTGPTRPLTPSRPALKPAEVTERQPMFRGFVDSLASENSGPANRLRSVARHGGTSLRAWISWPPIPAVRLPTHVRLWLVHGVTLGG